MSVIPAGQAPLEPSGLDLVGLVLSSGSVDGKVTSGLRWSARSTSHAVTCDYLIGRGLRVCSCRAAQVA